MPCRFQTMPSALLHDLSVFFLCCYFRVTTSEEIFTVSRLSILGDLTTVYIFCYSKANSNSRKRLHALSLQLPLSAFLFHYLSFALLLLTCLGSNNKLATETCRFPQRALASPRALLTRVLRLNTVNAHSGHSYVDKRSMCTTVKVV